MKILFVTNSIGMGGASVALTLIPQHYSLTLFISA